MRFRWAQALLCLGAVGGIVLATSLGTRVVPAEQSAAALADAAEAILAEELRAVEELVTEASGEPADALLARLAARRTVSGAVVTIGGTVASSAGTAPPAAAVVPDGITVVAVGSSWWRLAVPLGPDAVLVTDLGLDRVAEALAPLRRSATVDLLTAAPLGAASGAGDVGAERAVGTSGLRVRVAVSGSSYATSPLMVVLAGVAAAGAVVIAVLAGRHRSRTTVVVRGQQAEIADLARRFDILAHTDPLTGTGNEVRFLEDLRGFHSRHERYGRGYAIAVFEIDHLDAYVATYGAARADEVRASVARALLGQARTGDAVFRLRDDRFAVLLPEQSSERAGIAAERCRRAVGDLRLEHLRNPGHGTVTVSVGVAASQLGDPAPVSAFERACQALGRAVIDGRACMRLAAPASPLSTSPALPTR